MTSKILNTGMRPKKQFHEHLLIHQLFTHPSPAGFCKSEVESKNALTKPVVSDQHKMMLCVLLKSYNSSIISEFSM